LLPTLHAPRSYEHGVNTFDTANLYSNGLSEVHLGKAIKVLNLPREEIVVMTKVCASGGLGIPAESENLK
jgi:aryl-alcohol dehydrogenase-like predicted oxidoreductase